MTDFVIVDIDDWAGLYEDGVKVREGHSISYNDLADVGAIDEVRYLSDDRRFMDEVVGDGGLPDRLEEIPSNG